MEEELLVYAKTPNPFYGSYPVEDSPSSVSIPDGEEKKAIATNISLNGDYLKVSGALHEVVTDALRELADISAKHLEGKGKLKGKYTLITRRNRQTGKLRRRIKQKGKKDRRVKRTAPDVSHAFEVITLAQAAQEAFNVSYALWPVSAEQRRQNLINGLAPKVKKEKIEEDFGDHNNNNNIDESDYEHEKEIKVLKAGHKKAIVQLQKSQEEALQRIREENGKQVKRLENENAQLKYQVFDLAEDLGQSSEEEI